MSNQKSNGRTKRSVFQEIGFAIFGGLIFGFFIWLESYPHIGFFASWAAGTSFSAIFILSFRFFGQLCGPYLFTIAIIAGAGAGLTWWYVGRPKMHPAYAAGLGAIYAALMYLFEEGSKKRQNLNEPGHR